MNRSTYAASLTGVLTLLCANVGAQNLLQNGSFNNGLAGWTATTGSVSVVTYGSSGEMSTAVANAIGGGGTLIRDRSGGAEVEQIVPLGIVPPGSNFRVEGFVGGTDEDSARLAVVFLNAAGAEVQRQNLPWSTNRSRNEERVLQKRSGLFAIPAGATRAAVRVEFSNFCCGSTNAAADNVSARVVQTPLIPPAKPLDTQLLENGGFEDGWTTGSPLTIAADQSWEGAGPGRARADAYDDNDIEIASTTVSCIIGGGRPATSCLAGGAGRLLRHDGDATVRQRIDVRGNAAAIGSGALLLRVGAHLGGALSSDSAARIDVRFLDSAENLIAMPPSVGPVQPSARDYSSVLVRREQSFFVPPGTAFVEVDAVLDSICCRGATAMVDNVDARLVSLAAPAPLPLGQNVLVNGGFEVGSLPGSALTLDDPDGWRGNGARRTPVFSYGTSGSVPASAFSAANGLGASLVGHSGDARLRQVIDLAGSRTSVRSGSLRARLSAWLGGIGNSDSSVLVRMQFTNAAGVPVGGAGGLVTLGPVTAVSRNGLDPLVQMTDEVGVPPSADRVLIEVEFDEVCCRGPGALADDVRLVFSDGRTTQFFDGTGEDLVLLTGVDGADPTTGLGQITKSGAVGQAFEVVVTSPNGTRNFAPLVIFTNGVGLGMPPNRAVGFPSGLFIEPQLLIANGLFCASLPTFCPSVTPGGYSVRFPIPPALAGMSVYFQAIGLFVPGQPPVANGIFAATEVHELRI